MTPYRHVRMDLKTSKEVAEYLKSNDMVILPVGCMEMHGPLMPLGTDMFIDWGMALLLADEWKCLCLPPIPYVYPGASGPWPGTIEVSPEDSMQYVKAVVKACLRAGFKRTVISAAHGPMSFMAQAIIRSLHLEFGHIVMHFSAYSSTMRELEKEFGRGSEDLVVLGGMKVLGIEEGYEPHAATDEASSFSFESYGKLRRHDAALPWTFDRDYLHAGLRTDISSADADRVVDCMKRAVAGAAEVPALFTQYIREMEELGKAKPWSRDDVWTV